MDGWMTFSASCKWHKAGNDAVKRPIMVSQILQDQGARAK